MKHTQEELIAILAPIEAEKAVDKMLHAKIVTELGYDSIDSISKYMARPTSQWCVECLALGDWIDACWIKCHELAAAGAYMTPEQVLAEMPTYG